MTMNYSQNMKLMKTMNTMFADFTVKNAQSIREDWTPEISSSIFISMINIKILKKPNIYDCISPYKCKIVQIQVKFSKFLLFVFRKFFHCKKLIAKFGIFCQILKNFIKKLDKFGKFCGRDFQNIAI